MSGYDLTTASISALPVVSPFGDSQSTGRHILANVRWHFKKDCNTYVYFSLSGDDFDPDIITDRIGVKPTETNRKGNKGKYNSNLSYSYLKLSTEKGKEYLKIDELINEIVSVLFDKIEIINQLKNEFKLESVSGYL